MKRGAWMVLLVLVCCGCQVFAPALPPPTSPQLLLGNPTPQADQSRYDLLSRPQYALSFDRQTNTAAWASWQLNRNWLGHLERPPFTPDPELSQRGVAVTPSDYTRSGFDRGHLVPAADRNRTAEDSAAVFSMANIVPQAPDNNRGPWEALEQYSRNLTLSGKELYIVAGPLGVGGEGSDGAKQAIAHGKITVPAALWKIIVVNPKPGLGLGGITDNTRTIAVLMPNRQGIKDTDWRQFRTSIRDLERRTGYQFLSNVPQPVQERLETKVDGI